jgi:Dolichyl-phosphate-mannose-protein mannosyltransferase
MLVAALVVIPRCMLIARAHSETVDEPAHVDRGLTIAYGNPGQKSIEMNDPPFGDVLIVLPMLAMGANPADAIVWNHWPGEKPADLPNLRPDLAKRLRIIRKEVLYGYAASPEMLLMGIAIWKAILFVPFAGLVFHLGRWLYGIHAGWLALAMVLIDPTFAAHTGLATLDVIGVEAITLACYVGWRYFEAPGRRRLIALAITTALAFSIKYTAMALPLIFVFYAVAFWIRNRGNFQIAFNRQRLNDLAIFILVFVLCIWASTWFDFSAPRNWMWPLSFPAGGGFQLVRDFFDPLLDLRWPGGIYIGSFLGGMVHAHRGHWGFLWGQNKTPGGWWYYFFVVATYKIPLGFFLVFLLAILSLIWMRPRFNEWMAFIPVVIFCLMLSASKIDIGFRHFLPALVFIYLMAARCVAVRRGSPEPLPMNKKLFMVIIEWLGVAGALGHTLGYHPDYLSYINYPRTDPWRDIGDSNIDWGQSLKEVRAWLGEHPTRQPVYIANFLSDMPVPYYLDHRLTIWHGVQGLPRHGILIISPNLVDSVFDWYDSFRALRTQRPLEIIGHSMLVYDLDLMHGNPAQP